MANFTLTQEQYEALIALARKGAEAADREPNRDQGRTAYQALPIRVAPTSTKHVLELDTFLRIIEKKNGIIRSAVWVQWQESDQPLPPKTKFPENWPPTLRAYIELISRPVSKADVLTVLKQKASKPIIVLVTRDPAGMLGWTPIDQFFLQ